MKINYYSISSENAQKYYELKKPTGYYDYNEIKNEALEKYKDQPEKLEKIMENLKVFDYVMENRRFRENRLKKKLRKLGIKFIPHSYLTRRYIMHNYLNLQNVVKELYMHHILFTKCNIKEKWESYKKAQSEGMYRVEEKENFYKEVYSKYISTNPQEDLKL